MHWNAGVQLKFIQGLAYENFKTSNNRTASFQREPFVFFRSPNQRNGRPCHHYSCNNGPESSLPRETHAILRVSDYKSHRRDAHKRTEKKKPRTAENKKHRDEKRKQREGESKERKGRRESKRKTKQRREGSGSVGGTALLHCHRRLQLQATGSRNQSVSFFLWEQRQRGGQGNKKPTDESTSITTDFLFSSTSFQNQRKKLKKIGEEWAADSSERRQKGNERTQGSWAKDRRPRKTEKSGSPPATHISTLILANELSYCAKVI